MCLNERHNLAEVGFEQRTSRLRVYIPTTRSHTSITKSKTLTHISLTSFSWTEANSIAPDVTLQNAASHLA